jgi:hypothetical protein
MKKMKKKALWHHGSKRTQRSRTLKLDIKPPVCEEGVRGSLENGSLSLDGDDRRMASDF